jgi:ParB family chromosome partitioning protein
VIDHAGKQQRAGRVQSPHLAALEQELRAALGTKVKITHNARGRGKLVIHFRSHEEFERLRQQLTDPGRPQSRLQAG